MRRFTPSMRGNGHLPITLRTLKWVACAVITEYSGPGFGEGPGCRNVAVIVPEIIVKHTKTARHHDALCTQEC